MKIRYELTAMEEVLEVLPPLFTQDDDASETT